MLILDGKQGDVILAVPVAPPLERAEGESDRAFARRSAAHAQIAGLTLNVPLVLRSLALAWSDQATRMHMRLFSGEPIPETEHAAFRAEMRAQVSIEGLVMFGAMFKGVHSEKLSGAALGQAIDECQLVTLLGDVSAAVRRAQNLSPEEKKSSASSPSPSAVAG